MHLALPFYISVYMFKLLQSVVCHIFHIIPFYTKQPQCNFGSYNNCMVELDSAVY